ncbi:unnamed protein product [Penicillium salamii]|nr:unnamed protein product [Penicillium salamii]
MAGLSFAGQNLNNDLVSSIASLLDSISVPNLLGATIYLLFMEFPRLWIYHDCVGRSTPVGFPRRGQGRFSSLPCDVIIPCAVRFCEALILLLCRDYRSTYEIYWLAMLTYMLEYVDDTDILDESKLQEGYRKFYHALKLADTVMYSLLDELRHDLIEKERLPVINY